MGEAAFVLFAKVTPMGEEMGLVKEERGWRVGLGLHLKKLQSFSCASFHLFFGREKTWMIGASKS